MKFIIDFNWMAEDLFFVIICYIPTQLNEKLIIIKATFIHI